LNKRQRFLNAVAGEPVDRVPVCVWLHFVTDFMPGAESARLHARFFREYDLDLAKVVSDYRFPLPEGVETVDDPADMLRVKPQPMSHRSYREQLNIFKELRSDLGEDWPLVDTTFDPVQQICRRSGYKTFQSMMDHPNQARPMLEAATETVIRYVGELQRLGVDGVLYSTRGAATERCSQGMDEAAFREFIEPYDVAILESMQGMVRILHACKTHLDFTRVQDYPYEVLSWWDRHETCASLADMRAVSDKCLMGGVDQGVIMDRSVPEIKAEVSDAVAQVDGKKFILAPGCTIVSQVPQHVLQALMSAAREPLIDDTHVTT